MSIFWNTASIFDLTPKTKERNLAFKITAREKQLILKRRKAQGYSGKFETLLDPITVEEIIMTVQTNEKDRDRKTIEKVFDQLLKTRIRDAKDVFRSELKYLIKEV